MFPLGTLHYRSSILFLEVYSSFFFLYSFFILSFARHYLIKSLLIPFSPPFTSDVSFLRGFFFFFLWILLVLLYIPIFLILFNPFFGLYSIMRPFSSWYILIFWAFNELYQANWVSGFSSLIRLFLEIVLIFVSYFIYFQLFSFIYLVPHW